MTEYRPISRRAYCGEDLWRAYVEIVDGGTTRRIEALVDVNPNDSTPNPRIEIATGVWVDVSPAFVTAFRALSVGRPIPEEETSICGSTLLTPTYPLRITGSLETTGIVAASGGHSHAGFTGSFLGASSVYPNGSLTLEMNPINGVTGILEVGVGPTYWATQPILAPYGGAPNAVPVDFPQLYLQFNYGNFIGGIGRRYERLGPPVDAVRADLRSFPLVSVPFAISPFGRTAADVGFRNSIATLLFWASTGSDAHWSPTGPSVGSDLNLSLGPVAVAAHYQAEARQPDHPENWSQTADLALTIGTVADTARVTIYGLFGAEQQTHTGGAWAPWGSAYVYADIRPPDAYVGGFVRAGYNYLPPIRSGLPDPVNVGQFSGGVAVYPFRTNTLRIFTGIDALTTFGTSTPFEGEHTLSRFMLQATLTDTWNVGSPRLPPP